MISEWKPSKKWNPYNSCKLLAHVGRWSKIRPARNLPEPVYVSIDPSNRCNFDCVWCNSKIVRHDSNMDISPKMLKEIANFLSIWPVKAVCVAGGGEPLMNHGIDALLFDLTENGVKAGVITNGTLIKKHIESLIFCDWVGVSIDAGTPQTYAKCHGTMAKQFDIVLEGIQDLIRYGEKNDDHLMDESPAHGVTYKYLIHPLNVKEIFTAAKIAKDIGCKAIHYRPAGTPWHDIHTKGEIRFSDEEIHIIRDEIEQAMILDDETFGVYGITHKFSPTLQAIHHFERCWAVFMTCVFMPNRDDSEAFDLGLCCDRRGDPQLLLGRSIKNCEEIYSLWGSEKHWAMAHRINPKKHCPRCTCAPHNEIYENVILKDSMTYNFG